MFDPNSFMNNEYSESTSTEYINIPDGDDWIAKVEKVEPRKVEIDGQERPVLDVTLDVFDERVKAVTQREVNRPNRYTIWLDLNASGHLDMGKGKNVQLGLLRTALGQNQPGRPWRPQMLVGNTCRIVTKQRPDGDRTYVDVKGVKPL